MNRITAHQIPQGESTLTLHEPAILVGVRFVTSGTSFEVQALAITDAEELEIDREIVLTPLDTDFNPDYSEFVGFVTMGTIANVRALLAKP